MFAHVRLISFDLDDTLWPCWPVIRAAEAKTYAWLADNAPRFAACHTPDDLRSHRRQLAEREPAIAHDLTELRRRSLAELLSAVGYEIELAEAAGAVFREARNRVEPYDDVINNLAKLRGRYILVAMTNGNVQIEHTPLKACFDHVFTAEQVGAARPDPAMFHAASSASGVPLDAFLHAGDDPLRDVEAARKLGMTTVWVDRGAPTRGAWPDDIARADLEVEELSALVAALAGTPTVSLG